MKKSNISLKVAATGPDLEVKVIFDDSVLFLGRLDMYSANISYDFEDNLGDEHVLEVHLNGKLPSHTKVDKQGNIIQDRVIEIRDVYLDGMCIDEILQKNMIYEHDLNGSLSSTVQESFKGSMGCNGKSTLKFHSPIYLWLLENM